MQQFLMFLTLKEVPVNIKKLMIAGALLVSAVIFPNCGGGPSGPTDPPDPPPPLPDLVLNFPGAQMDGKSVTIFEGDSLGCSIELSPPSNNIIVGMHYDGRSMICSGEYGPLGSPKKMMWGDGGSVAIPTLGEHRLDFPLQSPSGAVLATITYALVVVPRPAGLQIASAVAHSTVHAGGQSRDSRLRRGG